VPLAESELIDRMRDDAIRCFRDFLLVPTIGRYAKAVNPLMQPLAAREVSWQVLESCESEIGEVSAVLSEMYPAWSAALGNAQTRAVTSVAGSGRTSHAMRQWRGTMLRAVPPSTTPTGTLA
jgi:hypothetical protein